MVPSVDTRETELHGLNRLQRDIRTKAFFVLLSVLALLSLAAIFAQPARADLADSANGVIDQESGVVETATSVVETTTTTVTDPGTTLEDNGAPSSAEANPAPEQQILADVIPLVADQAVELLENVPPVVDDAVEAVVDAPPVIEEVIEAVPPVVEDLLTVIDVGPAVEVVADAPPLVEIVDEVRPDFADVVTMVPPHVVDVVRVLPLFVPPAVANPGPIEAPTDSAIATVSTTRDVVLPSQPLKDGSQRSSGLFTKELVAEMTLFHLADLTAGSATGGSSASPVPEPETAALAAYVPIARTMPAVGGAGAPSSTSSSHSGSSSFGGLDAFSFFAALAALLALCVVGWIRDRSRSGRSIFPSHGGRPG
jgi:hypothetical protein